MGVIRIKNGGVCEFVLSENVWNGDQKKLNLAVSKLKEDYGLDVSACETEGGFYCFKKNNSTCGWNMDEARRFRSIFINILENI